MDKLGFKDGEMIEAKMINNSIERAQKKKEENNFGIRKRLLEYDDVMNKQRTVIYEKRHHALMGERIGMDISNMIWDRVIEIIEHNDYAGCKEQFLDIMAMEVPFTEKELDTLKREFPEARIVATPQTVAAIKQNKDIKLKVWGPQLGENAPKDIIIPEALDSDRLKLEGQTLQVVGLDGPTPDRTFVWIPSIRVVAGGIPVVAGEHVWMADTQTPQSHADWLATLDRIRALDPSVVIPGHYAPGSALDLRAVQFTGDYIRAFDEETAKAANSTELISAMKARYPHLAGEGSLELSAKVAKGEMQWP